MTRHPETKASEEMHKTARKFFFAVEQTAKTSPMDIDEFSELLACVCERYNLRWCQAMWMDEQMQRIGGQEVKDDEI